MNGARNAATSGATASAAPDDAADPTDTDVDSDTLISRHIPVRLADSTTLPRFLVLALFLPLPLQLRAALSALDLATHQGVDGTLEGGVPSDLVEYQTESQQRPYLS